LTILSNNGISSLGNNWSNHYGEAKEQKYQQRVICHPASILFMYFVSVLRFVEDSA
jgi:hypothetical protein